MKYACVIAVTLRMKQAVHTYARIQSIWIEEAMVFLSYTLLDLAKKLKGKLEKRDQFGRDKLIDKGKKVVYIILQFKRLL